MRRLTELAEGEAIRSIDRGEAAGVGEEAGMGETSELANIPGGSGDGRGGSGGRGSQAKSRRRSFAPPRTPEEIAQIRTERAAKRALTGAPAPPHRDGRAP